MWWGSLILSFSILRCLLAAEVIYSFCGQILLSSIPSYSACIAIAGKLSIDFYYELFDPSGVGFVGDPTFLTYGKLLSGENTVQWWRDLFMCDTVLIMGYNVKSSGKSQQKVSQRVISFCWQDSLPEPPLSLCQCKYQLLKLGYNY